MSQFDFTARALAMRAIHAWTNDQILAADLYNQAVRPERYAAGAAVTGAHLAAAIREAQENFDVAKPAVVMLAPREIVIDEPLPTITRPIAIVGVGGRLSSLRFTGEGQLFTFADCGFGVEEDGDFPLFGNTPQVSMSTIRSGLVLRNFSVSGDRRLAQDAFVFEGNCDNVLFEDVQALYFRGSALVLGKSRGGIRGSVRESHFSRFMFRRCGDRTASKPTISIYSDSSSSELIGESCRTLTFRDGDIVYPQGHGIHVHAPDGAAAASVPINDIHFDSVRLRSQDGTADPDLLSNGDLVRIEGHVRGVTGTIAPVTQIGTHGYALWLGPHGTKTPAVDLTVKIQDADQGVYIGDVKQAKLVLPQPYARKVLVEGIGFSGGNLILVVDNDVNSLVAKEPVSFSGTAAVPVNFGNNAIEKVDSFFGGSSVLSVSAALWGNVGTLARAMASATSATFTPETSSTASFASPVFDKVLIRNDRAVRCTGRWGSPSGSREMVLGSRSMAIPAPEPIFSALQLDAVSIATDKATTVKIIGALDGSTITLHHGALLAGMTLYGASRTIEGTPTTAGTATFTLRESLGSTHRDTQLTLLARAVVTPSPQPPPSPNLQPLRLDGDTILEDRAATIGILDTVSTSTVTLCEGALPEGMTLNSSARTISGTPKTAGNARFTLREELDGAQRDTSLSLNVLTMSDLSPMISAPIQALETPPEVYPIKVRFGIDTTTDIKAATHRLRVQAQAKNGDWSSLLVDSSTPVIDAGTLDVGLGAIAAPDGEVEVRSWIERADGARSPYSEVLEAGVPYVPSVSGPAPALARAVFLTIGDSLIAGRGDPEGNRAISEDLNGRSVEYVFDTADPDYGTVQPIAGPIRFQATAGDNDRFSAMGHLLNEYGALSGRETGIIPASLGGSSLAGGWNPSTPGANLVAAVAASNAAMRMFNAEGPAELAGVVISLGSNDVPDQATLVTRWLGLLDYLRINCADITDKTPIIITGGVEPAIGDGSVTRAAAEIAASQRANVFVEHPPFPTASADNLHPTADENRVWGRALATLFHTIETAGQPIPTFTMEAAQGSVLGQALEVNITHSGLLGASKYGVVEIHGGADAAQFEIGGTFHAPKLIWAGETTGPRSAGDYVVHLRLRNGAWDYSEPFVVTVAVAQPASGPVSLIYADAKGPLKTSYGAMSVPDVRVKKGLELFLPYFSTGGSYPNFVLHVDGNPATKIVGATGASLFQMWAKEFAIDTTVDLNATWADNVFAARLLVGALENVDPMPFGAPVAHAEAARTSPFSFASPNCPTDGLVIAGVVTRTVGTYTAGAGTTKLGSYPIPESSPIALHWFYRTTTGPINISGPNTSIGALVAAFRKRSI